MTTAYVQLPITVVHAKGGYTAPVALGSSNRIANVLLDTGSSTFAVLPHAYDPQADAALAGTAWAQEVRYGQGAWAGPVLRTALTLGAGDAAHRLNAATFALIEAGAENFSSTDGILGLAYGQLNRAHDFTGYLQQQGVAPALTWPWPFATGDDSERSLQTLIHQQPALEIEPCFTELEENGVVHDKFALLVRRALVHVDRADATTEELLADPLNRGVLVLGAGEECAWLHAGPFQTVRIVHDLYYNANLLAVQVGDGERIAAPPLQAQYASQYASNAIIDSGSSFLVLEQSLYAAVTAALTACDPRFASCIAAFQQAFATGAGIPNADVDVDAWPPLHFFLEGHDGADVRVTCPPSHYWQRNALQAGQAYFLLMDQLPHWANQTILGLPLLCGHYCVFDRRVEGTGVVRLAQAAPPA